tara:strand:- start:392 stop:886 length:495 start_codon:yes stop_codon:yes gene_type:complete
MKEQLIVFETAKLAKKKGFDWEVRSFFLDRELHEDVNTRGNYNSYAWVTTWRNTSTDDTVSAPTQSLLQKYIRETRGVHIEIHRNASGYYWSMCMEEGGTDLGWSDISGPNCSGVWDKFEDALEDALRVQLSYDLPNDKKVIKHWGNYVDFAIECFKKTRKVIN